MMAGRAVLGIALAAVLAACSRDDDARTGGGDAGAAPQDGAAAGDAGGGPLDAAPAVDAAFGWTNPVLAHDFPDPFVVRDGATYYAFATNAAGKNVQVARSGDLARWDDLPDALPALPRWAQQTFGLTWAPAVLARPGGAWVLYYTTRDASSGFQCVSRATSTRPDGPYPDDSATPLVCQVTGQSRFCGSIDASPFVDVDGKAYLVWKSDENAAACSAPPRLWIQELSPDGLSLVGPVALLLTKDQAWEGVNIEGPSMTRAADGTYLLFYSANDWETASYAVGYAVCDSPAGPCRKATTDAAGGPWLRSRGDALGPGGEEVFTDVAGRPWLAYHAWSAPVTGYAGGGARSLRIDALDFVGGAPVTPGPTTTAQSR